MKCTSQNHTPSAKLVSDAERLGTTVLDDSVTQRVSSSNTQFTLHVGCAFPGAIICCLHHHTFFFKQISFFSNLYLLFSELPSKDLTQDLNLRCKDTQGSQGRFGGGYLRTLTWYENGVFVAFSGESICKFERTKDPNG